jgi:hypothetical protein
MASFFTAPWRVRPWPPWTATRILTGWARRFARNAGEPSPETVVPADGDAEWPTAPGEYGRLGEWVGRFERAIGNEGWSSVVRSGCRVCFLGCRLPTSTVLIRTAHAVRAVEAADTGPRRAELARALGY